MKHEMNLTPIPAVPMAAQNGDGAVGETGSPSWPNALPGPKPTAQRRSRERSTLDGDTVIVGQDSLLTVDEFAGLLKVTRACVRKWILERRVAVVKVGRLVRLPASEVRRIIDEGSRPRAQRHLDTA